MNNIKKLIALIKSSELLANSVVLMIGTMMINVGNFVYHLLMSRMLDINTFGEFEALISLLTIISVPSATLITMITKYSADFASKNEDEKLKNIFSVFTRLLLFWSIVLFILFVIASPFIAQILQLGSVWPVIILGIIFLFSFQSAVPSGLLNGMKKFYTISWTGLVNVFLKNVFAIIFIKLAFELNGALGAFCLATVLSYFITLLPIKKYIKFDKAKIAEMKEMIIYLLPTFVITLCLSLYYNIDVLVVKTYLSAEIAGQYGAISLIGKIVFFITSVVCSVMFPMVVKERQNGNAKRFMRNSAFLISLICFLILAIYFFLPSLVISILVGSKYLMIKEYIGLIGIVMFFYSLINLYSRYFLAIAKFKILYIFVLGLLLQISLLFFFHQTISQVIYVMLVSMFAILIATYIYYKYELACEQKLLCQKTN